MVFVKISVSKIVISKKVITIKGVTEKMAADPIFASGNDLITNANRAAEELAAAEIAAFKGGPALTAVMYNKAAAADVTLLALSLFVDGIALANLPIAEEIVKKAGFDVKEKGSRVNPIFEAKQGTDVNSVVLKRKAEVGSSYEFQVCTDMSDEANWKVLKTATISKITITGLLPMTRYYYRVATIKGTDKSEWSEPIAYFNE